MKDRDRNLIYASIATFVVGDLGTTILGLTMYPNMLYESNPAMKHFIVNYGVYSLIPIKIVGFGIIYTAYKIVPQPYCKIGLYETIAFGLYATLTNSYLLLTLK